MHAVHRRITNWAGDRVLVVQDTSALGILVDRVTVEFDDGGFAVRGNRSAVGLACGVAAHAATGAAVDEYLTRLEARMGRVAGYLAAAANGERLALGNGTESVALPAGAEDRCSSANAVARHARSAIRRDMVLAEFRPFGWKPDTKSEW